MKRAASTDLDHLLARVHTYPTSHVYAGEVGAVPFYSFSIGEPRTADQEFIKLLIKGEFATVTYQAYPARAGKTFGEDLRAGLLVGLLEDLEYQLHQHQMRRQKFGVVSLTIEANGFGTVAGAMRDFCNAGNRILRLRTN